jgi:hypothetical protein
MIKGGMSVVAKLVDSDSVANERQFHPHNSNWTAGAVAVMFLEAELRSSVPLMGIQSKLMTCSNETRSDDLQSLALGPARGSFVVPRSLAIIQGVYSLITPDLTDETQGRRV